MVEEEKKILFKIDSLCETMPPKFRYYNELEAIFSRRVEITKQELPLERKIIESLIERHFYYIEILQLNLAIKAINTGQKLTGSAPFPSLYFQRNAHYLVGAFSLLNMGLTNQATAILRTIFETILESYLIILNLCVSDLPQNITQELTEGEKGTSLSELISKNKVSNLSEEENKLFKKIKHLAPRIIRQTLYTKEKKEQIDKFYAVLSEMSHPTITGMMSEIEYNLNDIKDKMKLLLALGATNLIVISEAHFLELPQEEKVKTDELLNVIFCHLKAVPDLIPDKEKHKKKLKISLNH